MTAAPSSSTFRRSIPIILPVFVNKCGDIGIRLFPMLLVMHHFDTAQAALAMGIARVGTILSGLLGGILGDRIGYKRAIGVSMLISATGMVMLAEAPTPWLICVAGLLAALGQGLFTAPLRLLLMHSVSSSEQKEAFAWLRTSGNAAVLTANFVAYISSGIGLGALFLFDAVTSLLAAIIGHYILPEPHIELPQEQATVSRWRLMSVPLLLMTLLMTGITMQMELFYVGAAAQARMNFGADGVRIFAQVMMINTFLCMIGTVFMTRWINNAYVAFVGGVLFVGAGLLLFLHGRESLPVLFFATLMQTWGELLFTAMSQITLFRLIPKQSGQGKIYGAALMTQLGGKTLGSILAFPLLIAGMGGMVGVFFLMLAMAGLAVYQGHVASSSLPHHSNAV